MERILLTLLASLLLLGGLLQVLAWGLGIIFGTFTRAEQVAGMGIFVFGGGFYLLASAIVLYIRKHIASTSAAA